MPSVELVEVWRGDLLESLHGGHAVVTDMNGAIRHAWGDPTTLIYPRSSCKMIQALPLIESGAAAAAGLTQAQLALSCASHQAAAVHNDMVGAWLSNLGLSDDDLRCGAQTPRDPAVRDAMTRANQTPCQIHNNCSGKHSGFLTLNKHLGGHADYDQIDHPVQQAIKSAFEDVTAETSPLYGLDGCAAPNHACTLHGLARAMAFFASAHTRTDTRSNAAATLVQAMMAHPVLVAGETRACTNLMRAMDGATAVKTGAEGVFTAIIPTLQLGVAVKITDGATRAAECAIAAILVKLGVLDAANPVAQTYLNHAVLNRRHMVTGYIRPTATLI